jgi:hypothetical protein
MVSAWMRWVPTARAGEQAPLTVVQRDPDDDHVWALSCTIRSRLRTFTVPVEADLRGIETS